MTWESITALAAIVNCVVLAVAAVAAVMQLSHLRLANQLESYAHYTERIQSSEMAEARAFLESLDLSTPALVERAITPLDHRVAFLGAHLQSVCRLLNLGVLDERMFFAYISFLPQIWLKLGPIAHALREREDTPRWADIEYLMYRASKRQTLISLQGSFEHQFLRRTGIGVMIERNQRRLDHVSESTMPPES